MDKAHSRLNSASSATDTRPLKSWIKNYAYHLPTLLMAIPGYFWFYTLLTTKYPREIQDTWLPNTYLPVLISFYWGTFFLLAFVLLHTRRGLILSALLTTYLYFRIQQVIWNGWSILAPLIFFGILELSLTTYANLRSSSLRSHVSKTV